MVLKYCLFIILKADWFKWAELIIRADDLRPAKNVLE
jgi:hypothetical protein